MAAQIKVYVYGPLQPAEELAKHAVENAGMISVFP